MPHSGLVFKYWQHGYLRKSMRGGPTIDPHNEPHGRLSMSLKEGGSQIWCRSVGAGSFTTSQLIYVYPKLTLLHNTGLPRSSFCLHRPIHSCIYISTYSTAVVPSHPASFVTTLYSSHIWNTSTGKLSGTSSQTIASPNYPGRSLTSWPNTVTRVILSASPSSIIWTSYRLRDNPYR
jgi:hypothetical protein